MEKVKLVVDLREDLSKSHLKEMRRQGRIPGSFYGKGKPSLPLEVGLAGLLGTLKTEAGAHVMIDVDIKGAKKDEGGTAVVKALQRHPITRKLLHVDFARVSASDQVSSHVNIVLVGDPPAAKLGGVLEQLVNTIEVKTRADEIPSHVEVDVSALEAGEFIHASEIVLPKGIELASRPDDIVAAMRHPHVRAAEPTEEAATTEE